jgi:hypothetical protein
MTLATNSSSAGVLNAVFRGVKSAPQFPHQKYTPQSCVWDSDLQEWVSFYWITFRPWSDGSGAQCMWLDNNADTDDADQFGIKLTDRQVGRGDNTAKVAAYAMYQRQKLAADHDLAPPVHGMCCFKVYYAETQELQVYWGYLSCVAEVDEELPFSDDAEAAWYAEVVQPYEEKQEYIEAIRENLDNLGLTTRCVASVMGDVYNCADIVDPDCIDKHEWITDKAEDGYFELHNGLGDLQESLNDLDIGGLQNDWGTIGTTFDETAGITMGGDLHAGNIALWKGRLVCIDFGFHCVNGY